MEKLITCVYIYLFLGLLSVNLAQRIVCPAYCVCSNETLVCEDGYVIDTVTLHSISKNIASIEIHNFVIRGLTALHFQQFHELRNLSVTDSRMRTIDQDSFSKLSQIENIDLRQNHLSELPPKLFATQKHLRSLYLCHNLLEKLPVTIFHNNTRLHTLNLSGNRIRLLPPGIFEGLSNLVHLDLSHNEISYILPHTFSYISVVRYINLSDNLLVTLHEDLFDSNNITVDTKLSVVANPLDCNCGLQWLHEAVKGDIDHLELLTATDVICANPRIYQHQQLINVPYEHLNCTSPTAAIVDHSSTLIHRSKVRLQCAITGSPSPSVVWKTPMSDYISDPYQGEWIDGSIPFTSAEKKYQIYATGETIHFTVESSPGYSVLSVDSLHLVSSGLYQCIALNPGGNATSALNISMMSSVEPIFYPSLLIGAYTVLIAICAGIVGCGVTGCVEKCNCCESMKLSYYDGLWMGCDKEGNNNNAVEEEEEDDCSIEEGYLSSDEEAQEDDDLLGAAASIGSSGEPSSLSQFCASELTDHAELTAEVWDAYFREYPDDFVVEGFDSSPKKFGSPQHSTRDSPTHRSHGKTLETLEGVRVRLKLRVEQMDVMKERLRIHMEKRSARIKETMDRRKERMNRKMQTIKETTSQSLQSIRETGRNYSHKLTMGVRTAMENVGAQVQSLKEFCGTGDLGQTLSIATITTDIDTNEKTQLTRSVTMV